MENDIAMMTASYLLLRVVTLAAFGYVVYRVLRREPARQRVRIQHDYDSERLRARRRGF